MKKLILLFLVLFSFHVIADEKIRIYTTGPYSSLMVPYLNIDAVAITKLGNDGQNAYIESLNTRNSFLVLTLPSNTLLKMFYSSYKDPLETMDFVAIIGHQTSALAIDAKSQFNTLDEFVSYYKSHNKKILLAGITNLNTCLIQGKFIQKKYGIPVEYISYKPGIQPLIDLKSGNVDMVCRYGQDIHTDVENKTVKLLVKFTDTNSGYLKNIPNASPFNHSLVLLANKNMDPKIREKVVNALSSNEYLNNVKQLEKENGHFYTSFEKSLINREQDLQKEFFLSVINIDPYLRSRLLK
jgi:tripartite-type tricarboxylate transporter receptor subunit TctC